MVKVSFSSALAQKDVKKDAETLISADEKPLFWWPVFPFNKVFSQGKDPEAAAPVHHSSRAWCLCMFLGMALMLSGLVVGGAYLYRYYILEEDQVFVCGVKYREEDFMIQDEEMENYHLRQLNEHVQVLEKELVELINVPVPEFDDSDPADIVHDFFRGLTAYLDLSLNKCYIIPLNTSIVMPPKDFLDLLVKIRAGTYMPQSYMIHEEMVVTERLHHMDQLGYYIYRLCHGKETYKLQHRDRIMGMQKREALNCHKIRHFGSLNVVETTICEP